MRSILSLTTAVLAVVHCGLAYAKTSASIDQTSLDVVASPTQWLTALELKGDATDVNELYIVIVLPGYKGKADYLTLTSQDSGGYTFRLRGHVQNERWNTSNFLGHPILLHTSTYAVYVFDNDSQQLLTNDILRIH